MKETSLGIIMSIIVLVMLIFYTGTTIDEYENLNKVSLVNENGIISTVYINTIPNELINAYRSYYRIYIIILCILVCFLLYNEKDLLK